MKKWKEDLDGLVAVEYIKFLRVPMKESKVGPVIDLLPHTLDRLAACAVVEERIPLRGKEVMFLRKTLGLSLEKFAAKLGLSSGTVFHWEKAKNDKLAPVNETAVRLLMAEELRLDLPSKFSLLLGQCAHRLEVKAS